MDQNCPEKQYSSQSQPVPTGTGLKVSIVCVLVGELILMAGLWRGTLSAFAFLFPPGVALVHVLVLPLVVIGEIRHRGFPSVWSLK